MDALSDVLRVLRLTGGVFLDARFTAPWCVLSRLEPGDCRPYFAEPKHIIGYHYVVAGRLKLSVEGEAPVELGGGDMVLLPHNEAHRMGSALDLEAVDGSDLPYIETQGLTQICYGGGGEATHIVCGFMGTESGGHPLLDALPRVMKLKTDASAAGAWIKSSFTFAAREAATGRAGTAMVLSKLSELLFVEAVRGYLDELPPERKGWLAGLRDPVVSRALTQIHARLAHAWTVDEMAGFAFLSRSAFAERFTELMGMPPMRYLALWRMQTAARHLRDGHQGIAQIALDVGYDSEAAFTRAFKRELGVTPGAWRRRVEPPVKAQLSN